jgi:hypothetical protein
MSDVDSPSSSAPITPSVRVSTGAVRVVIGPDGQPGEVRNLGQHSAQTVEPSSGGDLTGVTSYGSPLDPGSWGPQTVLSHPSFGTGRADALVASGLLVRLPNGAYALPGQGAPAAPPAVEGESQPEALPEAKPEDAALTAEDTAILEALPPLSPEGKEFVQRVTESTSAEAVSAYVGVLSQGGDVEALEADFASRSGLEPSQVRERAAARVAEVTAAAEKAVAVVGVSDFEAMSEALWQNPAHASEVVQAAAKLNFGPLLDFARGYQKRGGTSYPVADVMGAELGAGISKRMSQDGKTVLLTIRGQEYTFAEAVAAGLVRVSKVSR